MQRIAVWSELFQLGHGIHLEGAFAEESAHAARDARGVAPVQAGRRARLVREGDLQRRQRLKLPDFAGSSQTRAYTMH